MSDMKRYSDQTFEEIKHVNENNEEFWFARELQTVLDYAEWRNFENVIEKAKTACKNSRNKAEDHFVGVNKMVSLGSGSDREIEDYQLSRYACYLIVMNGDPRKEVIAVGQTYFAVKTRQQELIDHYDQLGEDQKRLAIRSEMIAHNKSLAEAAQAAGVQTDLDYAIFQNKGYQGLYGGLGAKEIHERKGLKKSQKILDHMGSTELAAYADELAKLIAISGRIESFAGIFTPQRIIGDEIELVETNGKHSKTGTVTSVRHKFGKGGFITEFTVDSSGRKGKALLKDYVSQIGGKSTQSKVVIS